MRRTLAFTATALVPLLAALGCSTTSPSTTAVGSAPGQSLQPTGPLPSESTATERQPVAGVEQTRAAKTSPESEANPTQAAEREPDVVYVPTPYPVVDKMLELAEIDSDDVVYDLGCGDGRIVIAAAKKYGARGFGFDIDPQRVKEARQNVRDQGVEDLVTIEQKDLFQLDLSKANVVTLYLLPALNVKLIPQLKRLQPGARIVSHDFDMGDIQPKVHVEVKPAEDARPHHVYLWTAPLAAAAR
ncbi:MAG TPA: methyltransferase domain-containing protein [Polyangiaceae bacterium]|nr:methyltransferase domain-containing protein [Polyangiaceae bacterium]